MRTAPTNDTICGILKNANALRSLNLDLWLFDFQSSSLCCVRSNALIKSEIRVPGMWRCVGVTSPPTWQMIAASCPTALGALCGQLTFRLAWCREHSAVTATELLQPPDYAFGTLFQSSCAIQISLTDCSDDSWRDTFLESMNAALCDFWYATPYKNTHLLTCRVWR